MTTTEISMPTPVHQEPRQHRLGDMRVRRIRDGRRSHIEPPLDPEWSDLTKLRWWAAEAAHRTDGAVRVTVSHGLTARTIAGRRYVYDDFCLTIYGPHGTIGMSSASYDRVKDMIDGIDLALNATYPEVSR